MDQIVLRLLQHVAHLVAYQPTTTATTTATTLPVAILDDYDDGNRCSA